MSFIARYSQPCAHCDENVKDTDTSYGYDHELVHQKCLIAYNTGEIPTGRNEKQCGSCLMIHAGECL
jgi:hypothetical protein